MFEVHQLNEAGLAKAKQVMASFQALLIDLEDCCGKDSREMAIARTKLEEACFFAKRAMAVQRQNQVEAAE